MSINKENYLAYFLDYHEGTLAPAAMREVEGFLVLNPDLREEFEAFDVEMRLVPDPAVFQHKESLKKSPEGISVYDAEIVAYIEGDLSRFEQLDFLEKLEKDTRLEKDLYLFQRSKLPTEKIVFPGKQALKKTTLVRQLVPYLSFAAAACLAVLVGYYFIRVPVNDKPQELAATENHPGKELANQIKKQMSSQLRTPNKGDATIFAKSGKPHKHSYIAPLPVRSLEIDEVTGSTALLNVVSVPQLALNTPAKADQEAEKQAAVSTSFTAFAGNYIGKRTQDVELKALVNKNGSKSFLEYAAYGLNKLAALTGANFGARARQDSVKHKQFVFFAGNMEFTKTERK